MTKTTAERSAATTASLVSEREPGCLGEQFAKRTTSPIMLRRRIGSTEYVVKATYSKTATETLEDKILRLIESEVNRGA